MWSKNASWNCQSQFEEFFPKVQLALINFPYKVDPKVLQPYISIIFSVKKALALSLKRFSSDGCQGCQPKMMTL
jgi:hypothetical protein